MYTYKFVSDDGEILNTEGYNLWNGAENCGIEITRADKLSNYYLQSMKFNDRVRTIWGKKDNEIKLYKVYQKKQNLKKWGEKK